jgi:hypothetical protein
VVDLISLSTLEAHRHHRLRAARRAIGLSAASTVYGPANSIRQSGAHRPHHHGFSHLDELEAERITIMREVAAQFEKPVMLYSIGKDSSVMAHLALKAFWPAKPPFPLLHVDTTWKFKEMIVFRDRRAAELGLELIAPGWGPSPMAPPCIPK